MSEAGAPQHMMPERDLSAIAEKLQAVGDLLRLITDEVGPGTPRVADAAIERHRSEVYGAMERLGLAIQEFMDTRPTPERVAAGQSLVLERVYEISVGSPTTSFVAHDKRHRPSRYELVKHLRAGLSAGADPAARLIDDYFVHNRIGEAYVSWVELLGRRLPAEASRLLSSREQPMDFVSLQYIGGYDLLPLASVMATSGAGRLICMDKSREAVRNAEQTLKPAFGSRVRCRMADPLQWLDGPECPRESVSILYAESLLQQLPDNRIPRFLQAGFRALRPGGVLLLGSAPGPLPVAERMIREWMLGPEWKYRSESECRELFAQTPFGADSLTFEYEPLGVNALIRAVK